MNLVEAVAINSWICFSSGQLPALSGQTEAWVFPLIVWRKLTQARSPRAATVEELLTAFKVNAKGQLGLDGKTNLWEITR
jgi:hypothetical protein